VEEPGVSVRADDLFVSSNVPPGPNEKRLAAAFALGVVTAFFIISHVADSRPHPIPGFILAFSTAMFVCDAITAILLFAQFVILRSAALLVIANGYVLTALVIIPYTLTFPGLVEPGPLIGGVQSAPPLYVVWHCGFPFFVIGYVLLKHDNDPAKLFSRKRVSAAIFFSVSLTAAIVLLIAALCVAGESLLPTVLRPDGISFTRLNLYAVAVPDLLSSLCALAALWKTRRSALDLWLIVVVFLYAMDIPFSYSTTATRFSVGWYSIRAIALLSSCVILGVLLYEIATLYGRLFRAMNAQRRERQARLVTRDMVAAMIAHEIRQPLSAMITRSETGLRWLDRAAPNVQQEPEVQQAKMQFKEIADGGHRTAAVIDSVRTNFKVHAGRNTSIDANDLIIETLNLMRDDLHHYRVTLKADLDPGRPRVLGDRIQLQQVLLNLITNAIDAMKATDGLRVLRLACGVRDGDLVVSVADTGTGIRPQDIKRVFEPLFTTKPDGTGMGLSICRSIIEGHGGQMSVRPNEPKGTIFEIKLLADRTAFAGELAAE
jgi:signal transduction histidine kinase